MEIYNESCITTINRLIANNKRVDIILTSPPYNTNLKAGKGGTLKNTVVKEKQYTYVRYDSYVDTMSNDVYLDKTINLFKLFDKVLSKDGVILYNLSYGSENTNLMPLVVSSIITETAFSMADIIVWKKKSALPNVCSPNKLTRICEFVYVFCRDGELKTFKANKEKRSVRSTGQQMYSSMYNIIEAANNDGSNSLNKATYSSELVEKLLSMYATKESLVYDPFIGTGTTAVGCKNYGCRCIGSEISKDQCEYAKKRLC